MRLKLLLPVLAAIVFVSLMWVAFIEHPPKTGNFIKSHKPLANSTHEKKDWYKIANFSVESGGTVSFSALNST